MARLSINELTTFRWSFEQDVLNLKGAGVTAIGVWRDKLDDFGRGRGIELLATSGLRVSNLSWAGGFTGSDGRGLHESIDDACEAIELAATIGAPCLVVYTGPRGGHTNAHARRLCKDALRQLLPRAEASRVTLAIKPVPMAMSAEWSFLVSLDEALQLVTEFKHPRLKLALDTYQLTWDEGALDKLAAAAAHVALVQLADGRAPDYCDERRTVLGDGEAPLTSMLAALESGGYCGDYDVLLMGLDVPTEEYLELMRKTQATFNQLLPVASAARSAR